jgi:hypothetical protein
MSTECGRTVALVARANQLAEAMIPLLIRSALRLAHGNEEKTGQGWQDEQTGMVNQLANGTPRGADAPTG